MANFDINVAGFAIAGLFVVTWIVALLIWHFGKIEQRWDTRQALAAADGTPDERRSLARAQAAEKPPST